MVRQQISGSVGIGAAPARGGAVELGAACGAGVSARPGGAVRSARGLPALGV